MIKFAIDLKGELLFGDCNYKMWAEIRHFMFNNYKQEEFYMVATRGSMSKAWGKLENIFGLELCHYDNGGWFITFNQSIVDEYKEKYNMEGKEL